MRTSRLAIIAIACGTLGLSGVLVSTAFADGSAEVVAAPVPAEVVAAPVPAVQDPSAPAQHDSIDNPLTSPVAAWDDLKAAKKVSWPMLIWAVLAMLGKALAYGAEKFKTWPVIGKLASWLAQGKRAMVVAGLGALGAAGFDVLASGGSWVAALIASGVAIAGALHSTTQEK